MSSQSDAASDSKNSGAAPKEEPEVHEPESRTETLLEQQSAMMMLMMQQVKNLQARVEVAEETAAKAASQAGGTAQSGDAKLERLKRLPYVPHVAGNPFPARPATLDTHMPQIYDLYNDKTYEALSKRTNCSM